MTSIASGVSARNRGTVVHHQSDKLETLGRVVGSAAHDFSNLLASIVLNLSLIEKKVADPEMLWLVRNALRAADRGTALTQRLLAFAGKQQLARAAIDLNALLSTRRDLLSHTVGSSVELEFRLAPNLWPVLADADQIELAIVNLALNARDAMPKGGRLAIETSSRRLREGEVDCAAGDYVRLSLADTGEGMSGETLERAFEPFFTTRDALERTGLGLSVVLGIAKQHGGGAGIESSSEGTMAELFLPRSKSVVGEAAAEDRSEDGRIHNIAPTVLVVDDDPDLRAVVLDGLNGLGCDVLLAENGASALEILASDRKIDLLMADVRMAGMSGLELIDLARTARPGLNVLIMTGYGEGPDLCDFPGEIAVLRKPFRAAELAHQIALAVPRLASPAQ
jgi:CheY-like chemotaxis protein